MEKVSDAVPNYNMKTVLGDFKAKSGKESYLYPACGGHSLHDNTDDNGKWMVNFPRRRDLTVMGTWY